MELLRDHDPPFLPTAIPNASAVERMGVQRLPVAEYSPTAAAALAFRALWHDLALRLW